MKLLLGIDIGTTAEKIALYDQSGQLIAVSTQEYSLLTPVVDFVEVEPSTYWTALKQGIQEIKETYTWGEDDEMAVSFSAQGETLFFLDEEGKDLTNAIVWMDNRATVEADELRAFFSDEECYARTGQVSFEACWPASKILWMKKKKPEIFEKTKKFLLIEDYFIYKMTGEMVTEGSLVCSSTYWDIITKKYWPEMLEFLGVKEEQLPKVLESGEPVGKMYESVTNELGLPKDVMVCTGCLDQVAGAIGVGNVKEGMFSENIGAALAICVPVNKPLFDPNRKMPLHYFAISDMYMIHTFTNGGMTLRWYRDKMCQLEMETAKLIGRDSYDLLSEEAAKAPAGSDGLYMLPHLAGSLAPDVNSKAKGVWYGFSLKHEKAHFVRSLMESLGYVIKRNIEALDDMGISVEEIRSLGGGSKSKIWNQIKCDILDTTMVTVQSREAATLGAAVLAGKAIGIFQNIEEAVEGMCETKNVYTPDPGNREVYDAGYVMYKKLFESLEECFEMGFRKEE